MRESSALGAQPLRQQVLRGLVWVGASQVVLQLTRVAVAVAVARLLTPDEYGLAASALVFAALVLVFSDMALGAALVQRKSLSEADRSTAFWLTVASGIAFTVLGLALSGPIARLYGQPEVQPLMAALSWSFILTALGATQQSLLLRDMDFRKLELMTVCGALLGGAAAIAVAAAGYGAWAIIWQQLIAAALTSVLFWRASHWRPKLVFSRASLRSLWSFSSYLVGHRLLFYLHQNADRFLIGRFAGPAALGSYAIAYNIILAPASRIGAPIQRLLAPAFARMQDEPERIAAAWARVTRLVGTLAIPGLVGMIVIAPDFVPVVLGDRWSAAIPIVQILAWVGILQALQSVNVDILMARDRTSTIFRYAIFFSAAHVTAFVIGLHWGVVGVAAAYAISSTLVEPVLTVLTARALGVSPWITVRSLSGVALAALAMAATLVVARLLLVEAGVDMKLRLAILILLGAAVFGGLCLWRVPELKRELRAVLGRYAPNSTLPDPRPATP